MKIACIRLSHPVADERLRALLALVEGEFDLYGNQVALRRLPRVSCYFANALPAFAAFRDQAQRVRSQAEFRRLASAHFRSLAGQPAFGAAAASLELRGGR